MTESTPFISVVMPVRNESRFIAETISQLLEQDYPTGRYEIIVVDGMSDDATREIVIGIAQEHPQVRLLDNLYRRSSAGRNIGFKSGRGDIFVVVDGHCFMPDNQLLKNIADCFKKSGADCLGRPQPLNPPGLAEFQKAVALARGSRLGHSGDSLIYGDYEGFASPVSNGAAYRREVFGKVGYVDENFDAAEDVEFNYRVGKAGLTCYTSPKLKICYYPRESLTDLMRQMIRYGIGRRRFTRKHPEALTLNQLIPTGFVIGLCVLLLLLGLFVTTGVVIPLMLTSIPYWIYLVLIVFEALRVLSRDGLESAVVIPAILFVVHFGLGYGFITEAVRGFLNEKRSSKTG